MDDLLAWAKNFLEMLARLRIILERARKFNITRTLSYFHYRNYYFWAKMMENRVMIGTIIYKNRLRKQRKERLQQEQKEEESKNTFQEEKEEENNSISILQEQAEEGKKQKGKKKRHPKRRSESEDSTQRNAADHSILNLNQHAADGLDSVTSEVGGTIGTFRKLLYLSKNNSETLRMEVPPATVEENEK